MELIVALALIAAIGAWWIVRTRARRKAQLHAAQPPLSDSRPTLPVIRTGFPFEGPSPPEYRATTGPKLMGPYAEMVNQHGGVREISAQEVTALFQPVRTRLASLRKVAANSTRVAQAFGKMGGATPDLETYRGAHREAAALAEKTEGLLDLILFQTEDSSTEYDNLLERVIDIGVQLEENLAFIADVESKVISGAFTSIEPVQGAKQKVK